MKVDFAYGEKGLELNLPDDITIDIVRARSEKPIDNPEEAIYQACLNPVMAEPLPQLLKKKTEGKICIVVSDSTRPVPSHIILKALDRIFEENNVDETRIKILISTGLHRKSTPSELKRMLGINILQKYDVINHVAEDMDQLKFLGENSFGTPIYINKHYIDATIKIITGYVEPHFFAGYSGGRKAIIPGIAGAETIQINHSANNIASPKARFGILHGNPIYEDAIATAKIKEIKPDFLVNVCITPKHEITKVVAGSLGAHSELVKYQEQLCFLKIDQPYDVVISGNGGYPLDLNLYQAVKSMAIGELGVKKGGTIISVNECRDGVGQDKFNELINSTNDPQTLYEDVLSGKIQCKDQWEIQVLTRVLSFAEVYVVSSMSKDQLGTLGLKWAKSVEEALEQCKKKYGRNMKVLVLPDGPAILPKFQ